MIAGISALGYLEYRQIVNRIRQTLRQPSRAIMYLLAIGYFVAVGVLRGQGHRPFPVSVIPEPYASALFFAYVTLLGIMMYGAASGIVGAFSSASDARFLSGSLLSQRLIMLWLQLRRSSTAIARIIFSLLLYTLIFSGSGTLTGIGLAIMGGTLVATATAIPMLKLRRIVGTRAAQSLAGAVAATGILPMTILLASIPPKGPGHDAARWIEHLGPGFAFNALFDGHPAALAALYAFGALAITVSYFAGTGLYPDLYASSMRVLEFRERQRRGGTAAFSIEHRYEHRGSRGARFFDLLRGPWTIVWKEWIAFVRAPSMQRIFVFGFLVCIALGALFGHVFAGSKDRAGDTAAFAITLGMMSVMFIAMGSAIALSGDIAKPLWWIGRDPLRMRLFAWVVATSWRLAVCLAAGIAAWSIAIHSALIAAAGIPIAIAAVLHLRVVGLALYSLFPSSLDQRGPLAFVRAMLTFLLAAPPAIAAAVVFVFHGTGAAIAAGVAASLCETLLLIAFASARIAGQGVAFARAESL